MQFSLRAALKICILVSIYGVIVFIGMVFAYPAQAQCIKNPITGKKVCLEDFAPSEVLPAPLPAVIVEESWGAAGATFYQSAYKLIEQRNFRPFGILDETQKRFLRQRYGGLVDEVRVIYDAITLDQWCALGRCINPDTGAQAFCDRIYIKDPYKPNDSAQVGLLAHELRHIEQCRQLGGGESFFRQYFIEFKKADLNYTNNSMEASARNSERVFLRDIVCPQIGCPGNSDYYPNYKGWGIDLSATLIPFDKKAYEEGERRASLRIAALNGPGLTVCNETSNRLPFAVGHFDVDYRRANPLKARDIVRGWYNVDPGKCQQLISSSYFASLGLNTDLYIHIGNKSIVDDASAKTRFCVDPVNAFNWDTETQCSSSNRVTFSIVNRRERPGLTITVQ